jgi:hypothetical protein
LKTEGASCKLKTVTEFIWSIVSHVMDCGCTPMPDVAQQHLLVHALAKAIDSYAAPVAVSYVEQPLRCAPPRLALSGGE